MEGNSCVRRSWRCGSCHGPHPAPVPHQAENIVEKYAGKEPEVLRNDFLNSLLAAYRSAEIMAQLVSANMEFLQIEIVSDRHFIVFGSIS